MCSNKNLQSDDVERPSKSSVSFNVTNTLTANDFKQNDIKPGSQLSLLPAVWLDATYLKGMQRIIVNNTQE